MKRIKRIPASSLVVTIIVALVLSVLSGSLILLTYYNRQQQQEANIDNRISRNLESALNLVLADTVISGIDETITLDLFHEGNDSVNIHKKVWGLWQVAHINSFYKRFSKSNTFFYGTPMIGPLNACLYMADHQRSVSVVGNTRLTGDAWLSNSGIRASYIDQQGFNGEKLINGEIKKSEPALPLLNHSAMSKVKGLLNMCKDTGATASFHYPMIKDSISAGFNDNVLYLFRRGKVTLHNCVLNGQVMILSDDQIEVDSSAHIENALLVAPSVIFRKGFRGKLQALAGDSIIIENECVFDYPSSMVLIKDEKETLQNRLILGDHCQFTGIILSVCKEGDLYKSRVDLGKGSIISGIVYTMGYLDLKAKVYGTVLTDFFIHKSSAAIYENYLADVEINRSMLSEFFIAPPVLNTGSSRNIVQWVQ